jgi:hypothetical protein
MSQFGKAGTLMVDLLLRVYRRTIIEKCVRIPRSSMIMIFVLGCFDRLSLANALVELAQHDSQIEPCKAGFWTYAGGGKSDICGDAPV